MSFGEGLKELRVKANLTQSDLCTILGLTDRSSIAKYESDIALPNLRTFKKICSVYNVSADDLLDKIE